MLYIYGMNATRRSLSNVDLNLLVNLEALLEEESVTLAADRVGLSQPAMSHALRRLRKLFGDELLVREGSRNVLTPRARALLAPLRAVLTRTSALIGGEPFDPATSDRTVTVAATASIAYLIGAPLVDLLQRRAPGMRLRLVSTNDISDAVFTDQRADVLLLAEGYDTEHERERLFDDDWVAISGVEGLREGNVVDLLWQLPHVGVDSPRVPRPYQELRSRGLEVDVSIRVNDYLLVPQLVAGQRRIGLHRRRVIEKMVPGRGIHHVDFPFPLLGLGVDMVWNPWIDDVDFRGWLRDLLVQAVHSSDR